MLLELAREVLWVVESETYGRFGYCSHFQKYKQGTLHMVKSLKLPTMQPLDPETMKLIFGKLNP